MPQQATLGGRPVQARARSAYLEDYVTHIHAYGLYVFLSYGLSATLKRVSLSSSSSRGGRSVVYSMLQRVLEVRART